MEFRGVVCGSKRVAFVDTRTFRANVALRIDKRYPFPKDSSASILTAGLLGEQYVGMDGGGDEQNLKEGDRLKVTQSAIVLEKVIGQFLYGKAAETGAGK